MTDSLSDTKQQKRQLNPHTRNIQTKIKKQLKTKKYLYKYLSPQGNIIRRQGKAPRPPYRFTMATLGRAQAR